MGASLFIYQWVFPIILLGASVVRVSAVSYIYLICFLCNVIWTPHPLLTGRKMVSRTLTIFTFLVSAAICVGHVVIQILYHVVGLLIDPLQQELINYFGFPMIQSVSDGLFVLLPDFTVFVISMILFILFQKNRVFSRKNFDRPMYHKAPALNNVAIVCTVFLIGISYPSLTQFIYFFVFLIVVLHKSLSSLSFYRIIEKFWIPLMIYNVLNMLAVYTFQIPYLKSAVSLQARQLFGLYHYSELQLSFNFIGLVVGWAATVLLFVLFAYRLRERMIIKNYPAPFQAKNPASYSSHLRTSLQKKERTAQKFLGKYGWKFCLLALLLVTLLVPSILGMILLLAVFIGAVVPHERLERIKFIPALLCYFTLWLIAQYLFNLPVDYGEHDSVQDIGLVKFDAVWVWIGVQCWVIYILSLTWYHRSVSLRVSKKDRGGKSPRANIEEKKFLDEDSSEEEKEEKVSRAARRATIVIRNTDNILTRILAEERIDKAKKILKAFVQWILENSYKLSLAGLYIACLVTVNLMNAGYLLIFIFFVIFPRLATRAWLMLVLYCFSMITLVYVWNFSWTRDIEGPVTQLIGLNHYNHSDLVFQGLLYHLIIFLFSIIQWQLIAFVDKKKKTKNDQLEIPKWLIFIIMSVKYIWHVYGLLLCYLVLYIVAVVTQLSLINIAYLTFTFICLLFHLKTRKASQYIARFWIIIVIYSGLVLLARYVYQFEAFSTWLQSVFPNNKYISLKDIGLDTFQNPLFLRLLGNSAVFLFSVIQFRSFFTKTEGELDDYLNIINKSARLQAVINFCKRFLILHSQKFTAISIFIIALSPISAINFVYLLLVLALLPFTNGMDTAGFFLMTYSMILLLAQMIYQFPARVYIANTQLMEWIGLFLHSSTFYLVADYAAIIFFVILSRVARRWKHDMKAQMKAAQPINQASPSGSREYKPDEMVRLLMPLKREITLFDYTNDFKSMGVGKFHRKEMLEGTKWFLSNFFKITFYQFVLVTLVIAVLVRYNMIALFYLLLLGICSSMPRRVFERRVFQAIISLVLIFVIILQYAFNLGLPLGVPSLPSAPWTALPVKLQQWLGIAMPNAYYLIADYLLYFVFVHIYKLQPTLPSLRSSKYWHAIVESNSSLDDFMRHSRYWRDAFKFYTYRYSQYWVLVFVFIAATVQPDLLSLGYVCFALIFLYSGHEMYHKRDRLWRWARYYNYVILFVQLAYQIPFIKGSAQPEAWQNLVGLRKKDEATDLVVFDYIIFLLLHIQKWFFSRPEYDLVVQLMAINEEKAVKLAKQRYEEYKNRKDKELEQVQREKAHRKEQLETLKLCRQRQNELWSNIERRGQAEVINASAPGIGPLPPLQVTEPAPKPASSAEHTPKISTTADIKRLQSIGALKIQQDTSGNRTVRWSVSGEFLKEALEQQRKQEEEEKQRAELGTEILDPLDNDSDLDDAVEEDRGDLDDTTIPLEGTIEAVNEKPDSIIVEEGEQSADTEVKSRTRYSSCSTPAAVLKAADGLIRLLDKMSYTHHTHLTDMKRSRTAKIAIGIKKVSQRYSQHLVYMIMMLNAVIYANILAIILPASMLLYALLEKPRPHRNYWRFAILFLDLVLVIKFVYQFQIFCDCQANEGDYWEIQPHCSEARCTVKNSGRRATVPAFVGIYKFEDPYILAVFWDLVTLLAILFHRHNLKKHGWWSFTKPVIESKTVEATVTPPRSPKGPIARLQGTAGSKARERRQTRSGSQLAASEPHSPKQLRESEIIPQLPPDLEAPNSSPTLGRRKADSSSEEPDVELEPEKDEGKHSVEPVKPHRSCFAGFFVMIRRHFSAVLLRKVGRDLYPGLFIIEIICFFYLLLVPGDFTGIEGGNVIEFILESRLPTIYVITILVQFIFILVERVLCLFRATGVKLVWHYAMVIFYHYYLLFYLPFKNNKMFSASPTLIIFYILKLAYLFLSGLQIFHGYPSIPQGRFLTETDHPGLTRRIIFIIYRAIPFLWELSTLLDWTVTTTALHFFEWLKLEDLFDEIFLVLGRIEAERNTERKPGDRQPWYIKASIGGGLFLLLVALIWFPLLLLMQGAPGNQPNYVRSFRGTVSIEGFDALYETSLSRAEMNTEFSTSAFDQLRNQYSFILPDDRTNMQIMNMSTSSGDVWGISPPAMVALKARLERQLETQMSYEFVFRRDQPPEDQTLTFKGFKTLSAEDRHNIQEVLDEHNDTFVIRDFFPRYYRLPVSGLVTTPSGDDSTVSVIFRLVTKELFITVGNTVVPQVVRYWDMQEYKPSGLYASNDTSIVTISNVVPTGIASVVATTGIVGLYVGVVLTVGRFLRLSLTGQYMRIMFEDMNEVDELRSFCKDIFLARQDGDLELEESLYRELIELYRSPERIILRTIPKKPRFKEPKVKTE